jgi:DNA polymerase
MHSFALTGPADFTGWRAAARDLIRANVRPDQVEWLEDGTSASLFGERRETLPHSEADSPFNVPRSFVELAEVVALHKDPDKFPLLYRFLWRLRREPYLLRDTLDADFARALAMKKSV